jgi:hypothetical protein
LTIVLVLAVSSIFDLSLKFVSAIISVVETCRRLKTSVRDYSGSVLPGLDDFPISRIAELTPTAWATRN